METVSHELTGQVAIVTGSGRGFGRMYTISVI